MYDRLLDYCERSDGTDEIRAVILTGAGDHAFVAGTDIAQFQAFRTPQDALAYEQRIERVADRLERVGKPTIAMIRGYCVGGGLSLALACDFRYASPDLKSQASASDSRSEEHTSELQSLTNLVCRLLLEKKKQLINVYGEKALCLLVIVLFTVSTLSAGIPPTLLSLMVSWALQGVEPAMTTATTMDIMLA